MFSVLRLGLLAASLAGNGCMAEPASPAIAKMQSSQSDEFTEAAEPEQCQDIFEGVLIDGQCQRLQTFASAQISEHPVLVVTLHGDSPFRPPSYHYRFAELVA